MDKKLCLLTAILVAFIAMPLTQVRAAPLQVNATDTVNITVSITSVVMIDVNPAALTWTGITPGSVGNYTKEQEGPGYFAIQIENIGSHNITHIWFNATYPSQRPFATGNATKYDAGNFVVLAREPSGGATPSNCANANYYFVNRLEFNETRSLVYLKDPSGNMPPSSSFSYGRFRNTSYEYFWMIDKSSGDCNGATFYIGNNPHSKDQTGTTDFQSGSVTSVQLTASTYNPGWCYANITIGGAGGPAYTIYVKNQTFDQVFFVHWNKDLAEDSLAGNAEYFWSADSGDWPGFPLLPGNSTAACIQVWVPYGVYEGTVKQGTLTVIVNDA